MKKLFIKASALVLFCLSGMSFSAEVKPSDVILSDIENAVKGKSIQALPFQPCILDWSKSGAGSSACKISLRLLSDFGVVTQDSHTRINITDLAYVACEVAAAILRNDPSICDSLAKYVRDENCIYDAFGRISSTKSVIQQDISVLSNLAQCNTLVNQSMTEYMLPLVGDLLDKAGLKDQGTKDGIQTEVKTLLFPVVVTTFALLVNKAYLGMSKAGQAAQDLGNKLADKIAGAGCFSWCCK